MIISVCNQKGGAGKTVTALNMFGYYLKQGRKPALIDLDLQGRALNIITETAPEIAQYVYPCSSPDIEDIEACIEAGMDDGRDVFILDCPPELGQIVSCAAALADAVVIPAKTSIQDQALTLKTAKHIRRMFPQKPVMILPTDIVKNQVIARKALNNYNDYDKSIEVLLPIRRAACIEQAGFKGLTVQECDQSKDHEVVKDYEIAFKQMERIASVR